MDENGMNSTGHVYGSLALPLLIFGSLIFITSVAGLRWLMDLAFVRTCACIVAGRLRWGSI